MRLSLLLILLGSPVFGQALNCGPRSTIVTALLDRYGETVQGMGLAGDSMVEVFASLETGTWTIAATRPDGIMCLMASGQNYETVHPKPNL